MRKQLVVLTLLVGGTVSASGASEQSTGRYLVATRGPAREARLAFKRDVAIQRFESVDAFAAELTESEVAELRKSPGVLFIEPDYERYAIGFERETDSLAPADQGPGTGDPGLTAQEKPYGIEMVAAPMVWETGRGKTIKVGVIDTGVNGDHPDLVDSFKGGRDFIENDDIPNDDNGHGTHVAGTIGAVDNDFGVVGVAPNVEIYGLRVLNAAGSGSSSNIIRAIDWAIANKLHVLNLSLGSANSSVLEEQAFQRAADAGIIAVAASGNSYDTNPVEGISFPAGYRTVVAVGAVDRHRLVAGFSQRGSSLKVVAPGVSVLSTAGTAVNVWAGWNKYTADLLDGSPRKSVTSAYVDSGHGRVGDFPAAVNGRIALIQRGHPDATVSMTFREKVTNAMNAGAAGVIIYNNREEPLQNWTLIHDASGAVIPEAAAVLWPVTVGVTQKDGLALKGMSNVEVKIGASSDGYVSLSGTSMAAPHAAGVAALLLSISPNASAAQVIQAITDGADDLGDTGFDTTHGNGLINALGAAKKLAPEKFGLPAPAPPKRRRGTGL